LDVSHLNFGDIINPRYGERWSYFSNTWGGISIPSNRKSTLNISSGLMLYYKDFIFGAAVFNLNQPDIGLLGALQLPARICLHTSWNKNFKRDLLLHLAAVYNNQLNWNSWMVKSSLVYQKVFATVGARIASLNDVF